VVLIRVMSDKPLALSTITPAPLPEADYDALRTIVMALPQGRWFLEEYARRTRDGDPGAGTPDRPGAVLVVAERLQDLAWTMRERGLEVATCAQIEELARIILQASALRDPNDRRAGKLAEVLRMLEARIMTMLESSPPAPEANAANSASLETRSFAVPATETSPSVEAAAATPENFVLTPALLGGAPEPASAAAQAIADELLSEIFGTAPELPPPDAREALGAAQPEPTAKAVAIVQATTADFNAHATPMTERAAVPAEPEPAEFLLEPIPPDNIVHRRSAPQSHGTAASLPEDVENELFASVPAWSAELEPELEAELDAKLEADPRADLQAQLEQQLAVKLEVQPASHSEPAPLPTPAMMPQAVPPAPPPGRSLLSDPLAALRAMSDEERIALFT
jgi:hypothetical protein